MAWHGGGGGRHLRHCLLSRAGCLQRGLCILLQPRHLRSQGGHARPCPAMGPAMAMHAPKAKQGSEVGPLSDATRAWHGMDEHALRCSA